MSVGVVAGARCRILRRLREETDLVEDCYDALLHRPGDSASLDGWLACGLDAHAARLAFASRAVFFPNG
jgi:hypothetical protein